MAFPREDPFDALIDILRAQRVDCVVDPHVEISLLRDYQNSLKVISLLLLRASFDCVNNVTPDTRSIVPVKVNKFLHLVFLLVRRHILIINATILSVVSDCLQV